MAIEPIPATPMQTRLGHSFQFLHFAAKNMHQKLSVTEIEGQLWLTLVNLDLSGPLPNDGHPMALRTMCLFSLDLKFEDLEEAVKLIREMGGQEVPKGEKE